MTPAPSRHPLSTIALVLLARMSTSRAPAIEDLYKAVVDLAPPDDVEKISVSIEHALAELRKRGLVHASSLQPTEEGRREVRVALDVPGKASWTALRKHMSARALGLRPGSGEAAKVLESRDSLVLSVLAEHGGKSAGPTLAASANALLAELLGLPPGNLTLRRMQAHVLARQMSSAPQGSPGQIVASVLTSGDSTKAAIHRALDRHWIGQLTIPVPPPAPPPPPPPPPAPLAGDETLLRLVQEAIPKIGSDGRYGPEKVFVSALWHNIARDGRAPRVSLDHFKRWLVTANRKQRLNLARADLVGAMDPRLVAESEIEDAGATFHFVLDANARKSTGRNHHAR